MADFEPKQFGKYYLLEKLAVGGMAEIYKAKTFGVDGFEKQLVLKRILPHCCADKEFITMLIDEAKLSVVISHANVVQVYDLGKVGEDYFISMEYINGPNLRDIIYRCRERNIKIPAELAVYVVSEICKGLDYAHRKTDQNGHPLNIVHRDVSPQNILISYEGEVKIVDFGIAKAAMNISHTMAGILKGKIAYMSPEQALGKSIDFRTDIFSTGIILYEILTQEKLFTGESQFEVLKKIRTTKVEISKLSNDIPEKLKPILVKALAYFPKDRFQSAGDMQIELTKFLYSTYIDFSPQKLASFVKDLFSDELKRQQQLAAREAALEAQTSSINVALEAMQENIVHREDTGVTMKATSMEPFHGGGSKGGEHLPDLSKLRKRNTFKHAVSALIVVALIAGAGFSYWKWIHPIWFGKTVTTGTVNLNSDPSGAKIILEGKETSLTTPAILDNLEINKRYDLKLRKEGFADLSYSLISTSAEPLTLKLDLSKEMGTIKISTEPAGAKITIGKEDTGKTTPAKITGLELKKELKIVLSKEGFKTVEKSLTIEDTKEIELTTPLVAISYGDILVTSTPAGALVYVDGKNTGKTTPAKITGLEQGKEYTVALTKKDFDQVTRKVNLDKSEVTITGELKKKKPPEEKPAKEPATTTPPKEPVKPDEKVKEEKVTKGKEQPPVEEKAVEGGTGTVKVSSSPSGADVFINSEHKGTTPATIKVPSGKVKVLVSKQGYMHYATTVNVGPGETKSIGNVELGDIYGEVEVASTPPAASVAIDGQTIGARTPVTIRKVRRDQSHSITVSLPGYRSWSKSFNMGNEKVKSFNILLEKE